MSLPTFSVATVLKEEPDVVQRFVDFYRGAGAERIRLFYDDPVERLSGLDLAGVELTGLDAAFWEPVCGTRPAAFKDVQNAVFIQAARTETSDWLLVADADEFLVGGSVRDMLSKVSGDVDCLRVRNAEAVWGPGDELGRPFGCTHFRKPMSGRIEPYVSRLLYGRWAPFFRRGLVGHNQGKQFLRRGGHFTSINVHTAFVDGQSIGRWAHRVVPGGEGMFFAHFDAISFPRWSEKWRRRFTGEVDVSELMSPKRAAQMPQIEAAFAAGEDRALDLFRQFYGVRPWQKRVLAMLGAIETCDVFGGAPSRGSRPTL